MEQEVLHHKLVEEAEDGINGSADSPQPSVEVVKRQRRWVDRLNILKTKPAPPVPSERPVSGAHDASWLSVLSFQWMMPLISTGYKRPLELNDIWTVAPKHRIDKLVHSLKVNLVKRKHKKSKVPTLIPALMQTLRLDFALSGACFFVAEMLTILTPFTLRYLLFFVQSAYAGDTVSVGYGVGLVIIITAMQTLQSLCTNHYYYRAMLLGGQARSTLIALISEKALTLSARAKVPHGDDQGWNNGRINNLMSTDTSCIDTASIVFHKLWVTPIQVVLALALLCINLGPSALVGFGLICLTIPLLGRAARFLIKIRKAVNQCTDKRVQLIVEAFSAIRIIKIFAWESKVESRVAEVRKKEVGYVNRAMMIRNGILVGAMMIVILATILTFITYSLAGHQLDPAPVFSSLALFNCLSTPLENLPLAIGRSVDAWAAFKRIATFMEAEERLDETIWQPQSSNGVTIEEASFTWDHEEKIEEHSLAELDEKLKSTIQTIPVAQDNDSTSDHTRVFGLSNISFTVGRSELIAVIGSVGSGKSSLLAALAGDMRRTRGQVVLGGTRALCSEIPWVQNASAQQNVTFGAPLDQARYDTVVEACALSPDFEMLPHGDQTDIGERGITLSGGQKQRLNIARSIYSNTDIVLLDDPLSAVDAHVGQHIMQNAICDLLKDKCRILATHQLHFLPLVDRIVWLKDGQIYKVATYPELLETDAGFRQLLQTTSKNNNSKPKTTEASDIVAEPKKDVVKTVGGTIMQAEERSVGHVPLKVYKGFVKASGTLWNVAIMILLVTIAQGTRLFNGIWLTWWASNRFPLQTGAYMGIYVATGIVAAIMMFVWGTTLTTMCLRASRTLLGHAIGNTIRAPVAFFDTTPLGRITNRFSKDVDTIDGRLTMNLLYFIYILASIFSVFGLVLAYYYYFIIALVPLFAAFVLAAAYYRASAREIKRHEAVLRSIVFSRFSEAVAGTMTIQAYAAEDRFRKSIAAALDDMDGAYFLTFSGQRWLSVRLDAVSNILIFVIGILIVASHLRDTVNPGIAGLIMAYMLTIIGLIQDSVHTYSDFQNDMNSVERLYHYAYDLEQEAPQEKRLAVATANSWPATGAIHFDKVSLRYRPNLPLVLKKVSFEIKAGERIGVIGRTGAGKSSIMAALFRLVDVAEGNIFIDEQDISRVRLHALRSQLAMIPQDPTLFMGTVRSNLDPFDEHDDLKLWNALKQANLVDEVASAGDRIALDTVVEAEGHNFSLGQRQLLALARVLVRDTRIVICDEATSSVDFETDVRVQKTMIRAFKNKTVLCIAHRLKTIVGYDRILVMDAGAIADFDTPLALFEKQDGIFRSMCDRSGISRRDIQLSIADMQAEAKK